MLKTWEFPGHSITRGWEEAEVAHTLSLENLGLTSV